MSKIAALIVAGGRGIRAGAGAAKQYRLLAGRHILRHTVEAFATHRAIAGVQAVIGSDDLALYTQSVQGLALLPAVAGGDTRQHSVLHGLEALSAFRPDHVLIHDAARPLLSAALISRVADALEAGAEAVAPLLPMTDALKRETAPGNFEAVPREKLFRAQTPQGFGYKPILAAHRTMAGAGLADDIALAERAGMHVTAVAGEERNIKITAPEDFMRAEQMLGGEIRTGLGFDAHRFTDGDHIWLCGLKIAHEHGLEGHSDADAGLHALTDAVLGALSAGDIGQHFPPTDERWRGASSDRFLAHAASLVRMAGGSIVHCDVTLICERPKIGPHREAMRARIAEIIGIDADRVSVKAATTEGMGFPGRREGLVAQALATIRLP